MNRRVSGARAVRVRRVMNADTALMLRADAIIREEESFMLIESRERLGMRLE